MISFFSLHMQTTITWEGDKLVCVQKGEIEGRGWTHWVEGDELHLVRKHQPLQWILMTVQFWSKCKFNIAFSSVCAGNTFYVWFIDQPPGFSDWSHNNCSIQGKQSLSLDFVLNFPGHSPCNYMSCNGTFGCENRPLMLLNDCNEYSLAFSDSVSTTWMSNGLNLQPWIWKCFF